MNTGLGLTFWRVVNEEGANGWAQIYARIPYDEVELKTKGALFGVVYGTENEGWAEKDTELMAWVEEYFNKTEKVGDLGEFFQRWREKYPELSGVWTWIVNQGSVREMRLVLAGTAGVKLIRKGKDFDIGQGLAEEKILKGVLQNGDKLAIWTEEMETTVPDFGETTEEQSGEFSKKLKEGSQAAAGLILNIGEVDMETEVVEPGTEIRKEVAVPVVTEISLVGNKLVGPLGLKEKIINWWITKWPRNSQGRVSVEHPENSKRKKWAVFLGVMFLGLLVVSLVLGSIKMRRDVETKKWQEFSQPIEKSLQEAQGLVSINPTGAKKIIQDAKDVFENRKVEFAKGRFGKEVIALEKKLSDGWTAASGEKESQVEEIARVDLVRQGFKGDRIYLIKDNQFLIMDSAMGVVMSADLKTKDIKVVAGKGQGLGWLDVVGEINKPLVLSPGGVSTAIDGNQTVKFDAAVVKPIAMGQFSGNLYVLEQSNKEIYKYPAAGNGYGDRVRWLKQGQVISASPIDMAMDTDIWVVSEDGQVERLRRGSKESFSLSGLPTGTKVARIAVEQAGNRVALLDSKAAAVIICAKDTGTCSQVLKSGQLLTATDLEFDNQGNLLVLLPGVIGVIK